MNDDVQAVLRSQEYFRIKRKIQGPGDIFELDESAKAIYMGPDSDIGEVQVTYYNPDSPLGLETAVVSVNGPFVGRLDSLPVSIVPSTSQPARILVSPVDIVDNAYIPPASIALRRFNIPALIDLIVAVKPINNIPEVRADRTLRFPSVPYDRQFGPPPVPVGNNGSTELIIPIYGRRMVTVTIVGNDVVARLELVTLQPGIATVPRGIGSLVIGPTVPVVPFTRAAVIRASDAARVGQTFDVAGVFSGSYNESDQPSSAPTAPDPNPRGMADLLIITLTDTATIGVAATRFVDVFIKTADRET